MSRAKFGWSLPPGAAGHPFAPWNQDDGPCAVCCKHVDNCVCPECPVCGEPGEPTCYTRGHDGKKMQLNKEQILGREECRIQLLREQVNDRLMGLDYMKEHDEWFIKDDDGPIEWSKDLSKNPDPFA